MKVTVHAGHAAQGNKFSGATGFIFESVENRLVKDSVIKYLKEAGHEVFDCTVDKGATQTDILKQICAKCNEIPAELNISLHFNSGREDNTGDGKQGGYEFFASNFTDLKLDVANHIMKNLNYLGFAAHGNPLKVSNSLFVLKHTKAPTLLIEVCFLDDKDDCDLYKKAGADAVGKAIAYGVMKKNLSKTAQTSQTVAVTPPEEKSKENKNFNQHLKDLQGAITDDRIYSLIRDGLYGPETEKGLSKVCLSVKSCKNNGAWHFMNTVAWVQCRVGAKIDGKYGNNTYSKVISYQKAHGLAADGIVGIKTLKSLLSLCGCKV